LVDETGRIAWRARATLWGGTTAWSRTSTTYTPPPLPPASTTTPESGLHYNVFRHYDPETGRYLTPDPLGLDPAPNPSAYVHNPHTWTDPLGLSPYKGGEGGRGKGGGRPPRKLDYLFNKDIKPNTHNSPRALQNELQLNRIGIPDTPAMREYVTGHLSDAAQQPFGRTFSKEWPGGSGEFGVTESVLYGPHGALGVESTWELLPDGGQRLSTVIFRGSGPNVSIHGELSHWPKYVGK
nr:type IV secretion protein Rhs [Streptomyces sp. SID7803]